jgi:diguanylate cyclase (GGDEF)-like protein
MLRARLIQWLPGRTAFRTFHPEFDGVAIAIASVAIGAIVVASTIGRPLVHQSSNAAHAFGAFAMLGVLSDGVIARSTHLSRNSRACSPWIVAASLMLPLWAVLAVVSAAASTGIVANRAPQSAQQNRRTFIVAVADVVGGSAVHVAAGFARWTTTNDVMVMHLAGGLLTFLAARGVILALAERRRRASRVALTRAGRAWWPVLDHATTGTAGVLTCLLWTTTPAAVLVIPLLTATITRARISDATIASASIDAKTGLLHSVEWRRRADRIVDRRRPSHAVAVIILDLDHFKLINDEHGHLAGDVVLEGVAAYLRSALRRNDLVGRFGGEEFIVLLPETDLAGGYSAAQRILEGVRGLQVDARIRITASAGVAEFPRHGPTVHDLVTAADSALYRAKRLGRNQVQAATESVPDAA